MMFIKMLTTYSAFTFLCSPPGEKTLELAKLKKECVKVLNFRFS